MTAKTLKIKMITLSYVGLALGACAMASIDKPTADYVDDVMIEFKLLEKAGNASGQSWFDFAGKARTNGDLDIAKQALTRAENRQFSIFRVGLERARINVASNSPHAAVGELQKVFDAGFSSVGVLTNDPVIHSLAGRENYDALIAKMSTQAYPCQHQPGFSDFDFWVGEWDVTLPNGTLAGTNSIQIAERGCVILENWTSTTGGTGMSINYLDKTTDEWVQVWNAEGGSQINIRGGLTDDGMRLIGSIHYIGTSTTAPFRALFTPLPDGRVRQFFEQSNDDGDTWELWFEGIYTRID